MIINFWDDFNTSFLSISLPELMNDFFIINATDGNQSADDAAPGREPSIDISIKDIFWETRLIERNDDIADISDEINKILLSSLTDVIHGLEELLWRELIDDCILQLSLLLEQIGYFLNIVDQRDEHSEKP